MAMDRSRCHHALDRTGATASRAHTQGALGHRLRYRFISDTLLRAHRQANLTVVAELLPCFLVALPYLGLIRDFMSKFFAEGRQWHFELRGRAAAAL